MFIDPTQSGQRPIIKTRPINKSVFIKMLHVLAPTHSSVLQKLKSNLADDADDTVIVSKFCDDMPSFFLS